MNIRKWDPSDWFLVTFTAVCLFIVSFVGFHAWKERQYDKLPRTYHDQLVGTVTQVSGCNSGKHRLDCWVRFSAGQLIRTDVTEWPGDNVQVGQVVYLRTITKGDVKQELYYLVVGQKYMRYHSSCFDKHDTCWRHHK